MLFRDRPRTQTGNEAQSSGMLSGVATQDAPDGQVASPPYFNPPPGEGQSPFVPVPLSPSMMPGTIEIKQTTRSLREPVLIPSTGKKSVGTMRPPQGRRRIIHGAVCISLVLVVFGALVAVLPTGNDGKANGFGILQPIVNMVTSKKNETALIAAQAATATAVTQDGYDAGNQTYAGVQSAPSAMNSVAPSDAGSLNRFFYGQCTYWANYRYHQLTGHWVPWLGNAYQWAYQAPAYGWVESNEPNPNGPSIVVIGQGYQGAGWYGHVSVLETPTANADAGVITSNWNWNGHWAALDYVKFSAGPGIHFVWFPG
jgi:surface antigen